MKWKSIRGNECGCWLWILRADCPGGHGEYENKTQSEVL